MRNTSLTFLCLAILAGVPVSAQTPAPDLPLASDRAVLVVRLPASATLSVGGKATMQSGAERTFQSPVLPPGQTFTYRLTANWMENGAPRTVTRQALVRAGERTTVDLTVAENQSPPATQTAKTASRTFDFTYAIVVTGLNPDKRARIWIPVPSSNDEQDVRMVFTDLPTGNRLAQETQYGNQMLYLEAAPGVSGTIPLSVTYRVTRRELRGESPNQDNSLRLARYLQPDSKVPVTGKPLDLLQGKDLPQDQMALARTIYDVVNAHLHYGKEGVGWGMGDVIWACNSRYGNCTDFHSVFISLARAKNIPAKFEMGFDLPAQRGEGEIAGYHCWAKFRPAGKGWVPVDISEANKDPSLRDYFFGNLTENRVTFSAGRDIDLSPRQNAPPLNFFIYPHVEVDGMVHSAAKVQRKFTFRDVTPEAGR